MIHTVHLFHELDEKLIELLRSLTPEEWDKQTVARLWTVKDVAAHLLDGNIRVISGRHGHRTPPDREINSYDDLVGFLNQFNADWIKASKRMSPQLLTDLLELTGKQYSEIMATEDLEADAVFPVAWAGEAVSKNWFHIAREYTEKWHHQQQIRDAVGKQGIMEKRLFEPLIATFLRGLPHTYRHIAAPEGTAIAVIVETDELLTWHLVKQADRWTLEERFEGLPDAVVSIPADIAWKLFTKAVKPNEVQQDVNLTGDKELAVITLNLIAVMA